MPATAIQYEFDWLVATYRPLLRVEEARVVLHDCSEQHVHDLLDEGALHGVDIAGIAGPNYDAVVGEWRVRRCVRVWRHSALHRALRPRERVQPVRVADVLPHTRPTIQRRELARWCGCAESTVAEWRIDGPRTDNRSLYHREAVIAFFEEREIKP